MALIPLFALHHPCAAGLELELKNKGQQLHTVSLAALGIEDGIALIRSICPEIEAPDARVIAANYSNNPQVCSPAGTRMHSSHARMHTCTAHVYSRPTVPSWPYM